MSKFKVYRDSAGEWRWRLVASNGRIVAHGESYRSRRDARRGADAARRAALGAAPILA
jgi:uncharacterized protein YegP (UPF0339 family)